MPTFEVQVKEKDNPKAEPFKISVTGPHATQEAAEAHVAKLPAAKGGTHAGLEVIPSSKEVALAPKAE